MRSTSIAVLGLVAVGVIYWLAAPLFINEMVDDALPVSFTEADLMEQSANMPDIEMDDAMPSNIAQPAEPVSEPVARSFPIVDTPGHPASGVVKVITTEGKTFVRFEDYDGTNGPDLFVYLAKDLDATEFVNLGRAKGNMGNINYEVPEDVDISEYRYVMTWCRLFGVLFDYAEIN